MNSPPACAAPAARAARAADRTGASTTSTSTPARSAARTVRWYAAARRLRVPYWWRRNASSAESDQPVGGAQRGLGPIRSWAGQGGGGQPVGRLDRGGRLEAAEVVEVELAEVPVEVDVAHHRVREVAGPREVEVPGRLVVDAVLAVVAVVRMAETDVVPDLMDHAGAQAVAGVDDPRARRRRTHSSGCRRRSCRRRSPAPARLRSARRRRRSAVRSRPGRRRPGSGRARGCSAGRGWRAEGSRSG